MSKRTYKMVITPEGYSRKVTRLIVSELIAKYPTIYSELHAIANALVAADNCDVRSKIVTSGLDVVHRKSSRTAALEKELKAQRKLVIDALISNNNNK
jgi:hypothetical protein